jgi:drug/metabolite transporter (DMT)-like permease
MYFLVASIVLSVLLLLHFRIFPQFKVNTFQAIVFNYPVCFLVGLLLMPQSQHFTLDFSQTWTWIALGLGVGFILTFILSGISIQKMGMTATSLANNLSLVIPVCASLFLFGSIQNFKPIGYVGLFLALVAVGLSTFKKNEDNSVTATGLTAGLPLAVFLMYGLTNTMINYMNINYITSADNTIPVTLTMILGAIVTGIAMLVWRLAKGQEKIEKQNILASITLGVANFLSFYMLIRALSAFGGNGAVVYPIYNIGVILLSAIVARVFFKEKLLGINKVGLGLALVAIILISWHDIAGFVATL